MDRQPKTILEPDPVIEFYKARLDRDKIRESLRLTVDERFNRLIVRMAEIAEISRQTGRSVEAILEERGEA
jgi:hypothetical protein